VCAWHFHDSLLEGTITDMELMPGEAAKTKCFSAMLSGLDIAVRRPQAIILSPTSDLAKRNYDLMNLIGLGIGLNAKLVGPGTERVRKTIDAQILLGTPGKIMDKGG
ncbi:DBP5, partial [Symbiodinium pilosum]